MATESIETAPPRAGAGVHRILVVANETVGGAPLLEEIARRASGRGAEVRVVAPALVKSRLKYGLADVDDAKREAQARLEKSLESMRRRGITAEGHVGDADPNLAIEDELRTFPADELIIATHPPERSTWLENKVVERAHGELPLPVTHVVVDLGAESESEKVRQIERIPPHAPLADSDQGTDYLPPMPLRDRITLVVGIVGTVVLGILALTCPHNGSFSGGCAVRLAIFGGAFMITLWHSVALLLMGSVRYRGIASDLAADLVLYGIPPAIVLSLLVG